MGAIPATINHLPEAAINENIKKLKCHQSCLLTKLDCFEFIESIKKNELKSDIIFLDPPYREEKINFLIEKILKKNWTECPRRRHFRAGLKDNWRDVKTGLDCRLSPHGLDTQ